MTITDRLYAKMNRPDLNAFAEAEGIANASDTSAYSTRESLIAALDAIAARANVEAPVKPEGAPVITPGASVQPEYGEDGRPIIPAGFRFDGFGLIPKGKGL